MARDLDKNTAEHLRFGTDNQQDLSGASAISVHVIAKADTIDADQFDNVLFIVFIDGSTGKSGIWMSVRGDGADNLYVGGRSQAADSFHSSRGGTTLVTGTEYHLGAVVDIVGDTVRSYVNGSQDSSDSVTFGAATYTPGTAPTHPDGIGNASNAGATRWWDGPMSEVAVWDTDIGTAGFEQLKKGLSPLLVRPQNIIWCWKLIGRASPEIETIRGKNATVTGTIPAIAHPRMIYPAMPQIITAPAAAGKGVGPFTELSVMALPGMIHTFAAKSGGGAVVLAGVIPASSTLSGLLNLDIPLAGAVPGVSSLNGALGVQRPLAGAIPGVAAVTGALGVQRPLVGSIPATSSLSGLLNLDISLVGTVPAAATFSGVLNLDIPLAGTAPATSTVSGELNLDIPLVGSVPAASALSGSLNLDIPLAGTIAGAAALSGDLSISGAVTLDGTIPAVSTLSGALAVAHSLEGAIPSVSTVSGILGVTRGLAGLAPGTSALSGSVSMWRGLVGAAAGGTTLAGALAIRLAMLGQVAAAGALTGNLMVTQGFRSNPLLVRKLWDREPFPTTAKGKTLLDKGDTR